MNGAIVAALPRQFERPGGPFSLRLESGDSVPTFCGPPAPETHRTESVTTGDTNSLQCSRGIQGRAVPAGVFSNSACSRSKSGFFGEPRSFPSARSKNPRQLASIAELHGATLKKTDIENVSEHSRRCRSR